MGGGGVDRQGSAASDPNEPGGGFNGGPGVANTGSGGGNAQYWTRGGPGGSGIVIIKYPTSKTITIGAGLSGSTNSSGGYKYTAITAGTGNVSFA